MKPDTDVMSDERVMVYGHDKNYTAGLMVKKMGAKEQNGRTD
jgi:hypothetical protein